MIFKRIYACLRMYWRFSKVTWQLVYGTWRISKINTPIVTIFGGTHLPLNTPYSKKIHDLVKRFINADISVLTGGGPGAMQAANCSAFQSDMNEHKNIARSIGIGVKNLEDEPNLCTHEYFELNYFFARKWLLTRYSQAFIIFPGGFGTLDELTEIITLMMTKKMKTLPVVLVGVEYWTDFIEWIKKEPISHGLINLQDIALFILTDDLNTVFCTVQNNCTLQSKSPLKTPPFK